MSWDVDDTCELRIGVRSWETLESSASWEADVDVADAAPTLGLRVGGGGVA